MSRKQSAQHLDLVLCWVLVQWLVKEANGHIKRHIKTYLLHSDGEGIAHSLNNGACQVFGHVPKKGEAILKR